MRVPRLGLVVAAGLCAGCLYIPSPTSVRPGTGTLIEFAPGRTTAADVRAQLGDPQVLARSDLLVYEWLKGQGYIIVGGYGGGTAAAFPRVGYRALFEFGPDGRLARYEFDRGRERGHTVGSVAGHYDPRRSDLQAGERTPADTQRSCSAAGDCYTFEAVYMPAGVVVPGTATLHPRCRGPEGEATLYWAHRDDTAVELLRGPVVGFSRPEPIARFEADGERQPLRACLVLDGRFLSFGSKGEIVAWDTATQRVLAQAVVVDRIAEVHHPQLGGPIVLGDGKGTLTTIDPMTLAVLGRFELEHGSATRFVYAKQIPDVLHVGVSDGTLLGLSWPDLKLLRRLKLGEGAITVVEPDAPGLLLGVGDEARTIRIVPARDWGRGVEFQRGKVAHLRQLRFLDARRLLVVDDALASVWDFARWPVLRPDPSPVATDEVVVVDWLAADDVRPEVVFLVPYGAYHATVVAQPRPPVEPGSVVR